MNTKKDGSRNTSFISVIIFSAIAVALTVFMTMKNSDDLQSILAKSLKSELISTSLAARGLLSIEKFYSYNSIEDIHEDFGAYMETLESMRDLRRLIGVEYIYVLKQLDGKYYIVFDTDEESETLFDEYEISYVHEQAFQGNESADILNVVNEYGSFNTGAVPIWHKGRVIGIVSTDIADKYLTESSEAARRNAITLVLALVLTVGTMIVIVGLLLRNVRKMQDKLFQMANVDVLTGLPNRQYLMSYLEEIADNALRNDEPFAFLLIDLDNFKSVNDGAGHDAGDELLRHFSQYLENIHENSKSFRPPAGALNVSARIGGDEFVQIVPGVRTEDEALMVAKKVLDNFTSQTIDRFVEKYKVGLSIGVALFPFHTDNFNVLIKYADMAMYLAKRSGKSTIRIYSEDLDLSLFEKDKEGQPTDRRKFRRHGE